MNFQEFIASKSIELEQINSAYRKTRNDIEAAKTVETQVALVKQSIKDLLKSTEGLPNAVRVAVNEALLEELTLTPKLPEVNTTKIIRSALLSPVLNEVISVEQDLGDPVEHNIVEFKVPVENTGKDDTDTADDAVAIKEKRQRKTAKGFERKCAEWIELLRTVETEQELDLVKEEINQWGNYEPPSDLIAALDATENRSSTPKSSEPEPFKPSNLVNESGIYQGDIPEEDETEPTLQDEQELINKFEVALKNATTLEEHQEICTEINESGIIPSPFTDMGLIRTIETTKDLLSQKVIEQLLSEKEIETVVTEAFKVPPTAETPKSPFAGKKRNTEVKKADVAGVDQAETPVEGISLGGIDTETKIKIKNLSGVPVELTRHSEDYILPVGTKVYDSVIDCAYSVCEWDEAELMNPAINKDGSKIPVVSLFDDRIYLVISSLDKLVLVSDEEAQQLVQAYQKKIEAISSGDVFA